MMTFEIHPETEADIPALNALSATAFGPGRFVRSAYRVREGIAPVSGLSLTAWCEGRVAGGVRFTAICVGDHDGGLLLGPLVVDPALTGKGCGKALLEEGLGARGKRDSASSCSLGTCLITAASASSHRHKARSPFRGLSIRRAC